MIITKSEPYTHEEIKTLKEKFHLSKNFLNNETSLCSGHFLSVQRGQNEFDKTTFILLFHHEANAHLVERTSFLILK